MELALAGFTIGMMEHHRKLADQVFERALARSASCAFVYSFGCAPVAYGGDAAHAPLAKLGRLDEASVAGARLLALDPSPPSAAGLPRSALRLR
jgi:hypothetical protein